MRIIWQGMKVTLGFFVILGLLFSGGFMSVMLYAKITGQDVQTVMAIDAKPEETPPVPEPPQPIAAAVQERKSKVLLDAPVIAQKPELPSGCEVTSLAMLLQYKGIQIDKMTLYDQMPKDTTPIVWTKDGSSIQSWGHPNIGYVGDATGKSKGFGIYHKGLFPLLQQHVPSAIDLTGKSFDSYEQHVSEGRPVVVWTTIGFGMPTNWTDWNTSIGMIRTTFSEHAVLMVGYDETAVYVNDPWDGTKNLRIDKKQFIRVWEAMGKQGLSYSAD
ncbi:C39 family peptidase [Paenibacillus lutrae]|nr:C39 family peptidase [Paenibacillus lutrae]